MIVPIEEYLEKQEKFVELRDKAKAEVERIALEKKIEEERIAKEKAEAEERERIRVENEQLKKEAEAKEKELQELFKKESLDKLKDINLLSDYGQEITTIIGLATEGDGERQEGDSDTEESDDWGNKKIG